MAAERAKGVTVVVGVGEGLGAALARRFAAGYRVALIARSADVIEKVAGDIRAGGGVAVPIQSDVHPQGIHVGYVNVDGGIDIPLLRQFLPQAKDEDLLKPSAIADAFWFLAHQDRSAWTHELDVRPFKEKF